MAAPLVMRGTVTKMTNRKPHVEVPDLGVGYDFGPCESTTGQLVHVGDRVLVVSVGNVPEDVVIVGILDPSDDEERMEVRFDARYYRRHLVDDALDELRAQLREEFQAADADLQSQINGKASTGHSHPGL